MLRQPVRHDDLLEKPRQDEQPRATRVDPRLEARHRLHLRQQVRRPHDRPRHKLREERQVVCEVDHVPGRPDLAAIHVHHVAQRLEGVEGDAHRQHDAVDERQHHLLKVDQLRGGPQPGAHRNGQRHEHVEDQEARVLEHAQHEQVRRDAQRHGAPPRPRIRQAIHPHRHGMVEQRRGQQHQRELPAPPAVEEQAAEQQSGLSDPWPGNREPVDGEDDGEEQGEDRCGKEHGRGVR